MIVVAGAAHLDRLGRTDCPAVADRSNPGSFHNTLGGAALNVASSLAALGLDALLVSCVGDDATGRDVMAGLAARGVKIQIATLPDQQTATYTAIVSDNGDLMIGLADMSCYDHFDPKFARDRFTKLETSDWLLVDANLPSTAIKAIVESANCNIAAMTVSSAKAKRLVAVLGEIDVLFTNMAEAKALTGLCETATGPELMSGLQDIGVKAAVITNGSDSLYVLNDEQHQDIPITQVNAVDVTGAGDGMVAGCLYSLAMGQPLNQAVNTGISAAQAVLQVSGPYLPDLKSKISHSKDD